MPYEAEKTLLLLMLIVFLVFVATRTPKEE